MEEQTVPSALHQGSRDGSAHLILNPAAGAGRAGRRREEILAEYHARFGPEARLCVTRAAGTARHSAAEALRDGVEVVVVAGGDGTIHETVNGLFDATGGAAPKCDLAVVDCGTGGDFASSLDLPRSVPAQIALAAEASARHVDVGAIAYRRAQGQVREDVFVNECQVGLGAAVCDRLGRVGKRLGGPLAFGATALAVGLRYRGQPMTVVLDGEQTIRQRLLGVIVANGARCAGGMRLTPGAALDDGLLDVLLIHDQSRWERIRFFPRVYTGRHVDTSGCTYLSCRRATIRTDGPVPVAADGELLGTTPCEIDLHAHALRVRRGSHHAGAKAEQKVRRKGKRTGRPG